MVELRAVVLDAPETLTVEDRPDPTVGRGEVLLDVATTGVCGTDVSIYKGKIPVRYPLIMGHELAGTVIEAGDGAGPINAGQRVVVDPTLTCGSCYQCSRGQENLCTRGALMGRDTDGGFRTKLAVPAANVHVLPASIPDHVAPLIQVATVCMHGQRSIDIFPSESVAIVGLGVTGLLHLQLALARGAHPVIGITRSANKRTLAEKLGADLTIDAADDGVEEFVRAATGGRGPDIVIEAAGKVETLARSIELVRVGGRIMVYGTITEHSGHLPFYQLYYKEILLTNPRASKPEDFPACIDMVASGALQLEPIISNTFQLADARAAIEATQTGGTLKVVLNHGE